jgi:hypothetical protein
MPRRARSSFPFAVAAVVLMIAAGCSTSKNEATATCTSDGKECQHDGECCTKYCQLQSGDHAYCQVDHGSSACSADRGPCTEDSHCCQGVCLDHTCVSNATACGQTGQACTDSSFCCSGYCVQGTCQPPPRDNRTNCAPEGGGCARPDDCCIGFCVDTGGGAKVCVGHVTSGGGSNCGATNAFCRQNADCCTQLCQQTASSGVCR